LTAFGASLIFAAMTLIRKLFWIALFFVATFGFVVLFDHGTLDYSKNAKAEFEDLKKMFNFQVQRKKDDSDKIGK
jgi:hypothetical protein